MTETRAPYTPGPWRLERGQVVDADGDALASVPYVLGDATDQANARLIAAAPELADAARALLDKLDDMTTDDFAHGGERAERERLRAALAAAVEEAHKPAAGLEVTP